MFETKRLALLSLLVGISILLLLQVPPGDSSHGKQGEKSQNPQKAQSDDQRPSLEKSLQKIDKMSHLALTVLGDSVEALLRRDYQLADGTVDNAENIRTLEDDVITAMEKDRADDLGNIKLALEDIRRTAEYASDIAEVAMNDTIDEVTEKHSANRRK